MTSPPSPERATTFIRELGLRDVVLMNISAVVGLRWIARGARVGAPSVTLWVLAALAFFVPLSVAVSRLARRYPEQGGLYAWTRHALGPFHGFLCGWCLWVNNLSYFPSLLLFGAANALLIFGPRFSALEESRSYSTLFVLIALWASIGLNVVGMRVAKWFQNVGSIGTWVPAALLLGFGAVAFFSYGSATSFAPAALLPRDDFWSTLSLWSAMCFAFSGFEITAFLGQEVKNPERTIPRGVFLAGIATTLIYLLGSVSVLVAVPANALSERSGVSDAIELTASRVGLFGLGALMGGLQAIGALTGTVSWVAGAARVPFAAGVDSVMPRAFARLHPRYHTPHVALIVQGLAASALFLSSVFVTLVGARATIREAYDILVNLTILIYFIPYLYLFVALWRLRGEVSGPLPGERVRVLLAVTVGFIATAVALGLLFVPPAGTENVWNYRVNLILQAALVLLVGLGLYAYALRRQ